MVELFFGIVYLKLDSFEDFVDRLFVVVFSFVKRSCYRSTSWMSIGRMDGLQSL